jgi:hypothetical protein
MSDPIEPQKDNANAASARPDRGRRRLVQGSLGAAPLLMTLVSRPVLGGNNQCFSPSGYHSMPTSQHGQPQFCLGRTPGYWKQKQHFKSWVPPYYPVTKPGPGGPVATLFKDWFSPAPGALYTMTFLEALDAGGGPPNPLARHIVASILNVAIGWVPAPVLTVASLQGIWHQYITLGYFEPTAGVKWYHDEIVDYLQHTMTL